MATRHMLCIVAITCVMLQGFAASNLSKINRSMYTYQTTNAECMSCINTGKWCTYDFHETYGNCCDSDDDGYYCGGTGYYHCNTDSKFDDYGGYALCPINESDCGSQTFTYLSTDLSHTFTSNSFDTDTVCAYQLISSTEKITSYKITINSLVNAKAHIYKEENRYSLEHEASVTSESTTKFRLSEYTNAFIVVVPTGSNASINFTATSDEWTSGGSSSGISPLAIAAIVITPIAFGGILVCLALIRTYHLNKFKNSRLGEASIKVEPASRSEYTPEALDQSDNSSVFSGLQSNPSLLQSPELYNSNCHTPSDPYNSLYQQQPPISPKAPNSLHSHYNMSSHSSFSSGLARDSAGIAKEAAGPAKESNYSSSLARGLSHSTDPAMMESEPSSYAPKKIYYHQ